MKSLNKKFKNLTDQVKIEKYSVEYDKYDLHTFRDIKNNSPKIKETNKNGIEMYPQFNELHQDLFDALYKYEPKKIPDSRIAHLYGLNSQVIDAILQSPKYKELRNLTKLDVIGATVGTEALGDDVKKLIEELKDEWEKAMEEADKAAGAMKAAKDAMGDATGKAKAQAELEYKQAQALLEEHMKKAQNVIEKTERRAVNKMMEEAIKEATATSNMITNWGLEQDPTYMRSGYQDKLAMLDRLRKSRKLREIAELAGRYKRMALQTQREKVKKGVDAVYDITRGNDLGHILPSEAMKLGDPLQKLTFLKDFVEGSLLQYQYSGNQKKHKGPIVVCIDDSGSMSGQPEVFAKSVALGLLEIARVQKRSMYVIHFDASPKNRLHTNTFPKKTPQNIEEILDMAEYFSGGGTQFEPPLELAKDKIEEDGDYSKADIIFITDGEAAVREKWLAEFLKWKKSRNISIYTVLIDAYSNSRSAVDSFSDSIEKFSAMRTDSHDEIALTLFLSM